MVMLELFQGTDPRVDAASEPSPFLAHTKSLKCLACQHEFDVTAGTSFDTAVECEACGAHSEVRLLHEAWCVDRRAAFGMLAPKRAEQKAMRLKLVRAG